MDRKEGKFSRLLAISTREIGRKREAHENILVENFLRDGKTDF